MNYRTDIFPVYCITGLGIIIKMRVIFRHLKFTHLVLISQLTTRSENKTGTDIFLCKQYCINKTARKKNQIFRSLNLVLNSNDSRKKTCINLKSTQAWSLVLFWWKLMTAGCYCGNCSLVFITIVLGQGFFLSFTLFVRYSRNMSTIRRVPLTFIVGLLPHECMLEMLSEFSQTMFFL